MLFPALPFMKARTLAAGLVMPVLLVLAACASGGRDTRTSRSMDAGGRDGAVPSAPDAGEVDAGKPASCAVDAECDDGLACNGIERCLAEECTTDPAPGCDDGIGCTVDECVEPAGECTHLPDHGACGGMDMCDATSGCVTPPSCSADGECDDGVACNGVETCDPATGCRAGTPVSCDDGLSCTTDRCSEPDGACSNVGTDADGDGHVAVGCGTGGDCDDSAAAVNPGASEVCDGIDNDCDSTADDGYACVLGSGTSSCTTTCGTPGARACNAVCVFGPCAAAAEVCGNMCDDDLDGVPDDGCGPTAPANDTCMGAQTITGSATRADTLVGATAQTTDCGNGVEVFYRLTVTQRSFVYLDTFGSGFDTRLSYRGTSCPGSSTQCIDDSCGTLQSQLGVVVDSGTHYFAVHTYSSGITPGAFTLKHVIAPAAAGDNTLISGPGTFSGSTSGSSGISAACGGSALSADDSFYWLQCAADTRTVSATTCLMATNYDTVLHVHGPTGELACNDDSSCSFSGLRSNVSAGASGAGLFALIVDGFSSGSTGSYSVTIAW